jgi:23S rRNA pseudouridine1911/1915/1917 synthase
VLRPDFVPDDSILLTFPVPRELAGLRLDQFIQTRIPRLSRTRAKDIVEACARRADGTQRRASDRVREGEVVLLVRPRFIEPETPQSFEVIHEDEAILAIDKPPGLPMHPTATYHRNTLTFLLRQRYGEPTPHIAHRLDRETSGLVLCGRTLDDERALKRAFERREVKKTYLAIARGEIAEDSGRIALPLANVQEGLHVMMEVRDAGEQSHAVTEWRVIERRAGRTLVALSPLTGRQHQLRVHLASIGHPIVGDKLYGPEREQPFLDYIDTGMTPELEARVGHVRQALHAHEVVLAHPRTRMPLTLRSPLAPDLQALWDRSTSNPHVDPADRPV